MIQTRRSLQSPPHFTNGNETDYVYSAAGEKLRVYHRTAVSGIKRSYGSYDALTNAQTLSVDFTTNIDNLEIDQTYSSKYYFSTGYLALGNTGSGTFHYFAKDHEGNVRAVVNQDGTVEQVNNYFAFGGLLNDVTTGSDLQKRKYNGKELDRMFGLDWYDYGARNFDAVIGRWHSMDPLCEKYYSVSPYAYCCNNPVNAVDPDGRDYTLVMNSQDKTMTINATYYAMADDAKFAQSAAESWNANSGQFGYEVNGENYTINFNLNVVSVDNSYPELGPKGEMASLVTKLNSDKSGQANIFRIVSNLPTNVELDNGETADVMGQTNKNYIKVKNGSSIDVAKHEEGHSLGMVHSNSGVMTVATNSSGNSNNPSAGSIKQCIKSAINGKTYDPAAGIGTFINNTGITQEELRKGNVYEIPKH